MLMNGLESICVIYSCCRTSNLVIGLDPPVIASSLNVTLLAGARPPNDVPAICIVSPFSYPVPPALIAIDVIVPAPLVVTFTVNPLPSICAVVGIAVNVVDGVYAVAVCVIVAASILDATP